MSEDEAMQLLRLVASEDGISVPKVARKMALSQSYLLRGLTRLGHSEVMGGLGWIEMRGAEPVRLHLSDAGRQWLEQHHEA